MSQRERHYESVLKVMVDIRRKVTNRRLNKSSNCRVHRLRQITGSERIELSNSSRLRHELMDVLINPPPLCSARLKGNYLREWVATIRGPPASVYEGGVFELNLQFPKDYPHKPPRVKFLTRIYHCNINLNGSICLDILNKKWNPSLCVSAILLSICSLLSDCNPTDALMGGIASLYVKNRDEHDRQARLFTKRFACPKMLLWLKPL